MIGTTAINQPDLHNTIFPKWKKWLLESGKKLVWIVNIDTISYLQETYEATKQNFQILLGDIHQLIILPQQHNTLLGACKNISSCMKTYVENNNINKNELKVVWLEDDWELDTILTFNGLLQYSGQKTHINLSGIINNYIWALAPSILSYGFWEEIYYHAWLYQSVDIDAEKCVGNFFQNQYYSSDHVLSITLDETTTEIPKEIWEGTPLFIKVSPAIAIDQGINYLKNREIKKKWIKEGRSVSFTYQKI